MKPITVTTTVSRPIDEVYEHLAVLGNHEAFTDHMLVDWKLSGPASGVGAVAEASSTLGGRKEPARFELVEADPPVRLLERSVAAKGRRVGTGEYTLADAGDGRTDVTFTFRLERAPVWERPILPLLVPKLRRANQTALDRLAEQLGAPAAAASAR